MNMKLAAILAGLVIAGTASAQEIKDASAPVAPFNGVSPNLTGGPDTFGYTFLDSNEATCPFQYVDITATGVQVATGDDAGSGGVALAGPPINFYGTVYSNLNPTTNGYISTDPADTGPDLSNDCPLPATPSTGSGGRMYPMHDDLVTGSLLFEYFASCPRDNGYGSPEGCYVFQWNDVIHFGGAEAPWSFQTIVYDTSFGIVYQHLAGNPELGSGSTTGIQNDGATDGLTYACNAASSVVGNSAQCFIHPDFPQGSGAAPQIDLPASSPLTMLLLALGAGLAGVWAFTRRRKHSV
jgi:hypothetical protein